VLVVDDDPLVITNTILMLEDLGHEVVQAHSGEEALRALSRDEELDLVLTDHSMPNMTGAQLAARVRELKPDLPILLATGYAELAASSPEAELPRLAKPFTQLELENAIWRVLPA
jgi:CheY-like chemotaxis protein